MNTIPCLDDFLNECGSTITSHTSDSYPELIGFKYTPSTKYSANWNAVSLRSRGIVFDTSTGKVIAHPFDTFFNYEELRDYGSRIHTILGLQDSYKFHPIMSGSFRVMDKLDGSLGIAFHWNNQWIVKTCGRFNSPEAIWATQFLNNSNIHTDKMRPEYTYCFEIIWHDDPFVHPLTHVYTKDDMVLIGVIRTDTGNEMGTDDLKAEANAINSTLAEIYEFDDFTKVYAFAKSLPNDKEGIVVTFDTGFKLKIKGDEFLKLQKIFHNMSPTTIIDAISGGKVTIKELIPEEMPDIRAFAEKIETVYKEKYLMCQKISDSIKSMPRKDGYRIASINKYLYPSILRMAYGGHVFFDLDFIKWAKETYAHDGIL